MAKILGRINKKTGEMTLKVEGVEGEACMNLPQMQKLVAGLGMQDSEVEKTPEYYQQETVSESEQDRA